MYKDQNMYTNLLMSIALRAGEMDAMGKIELDTTVSGEEQIYRFFRAVVHDYLGAEDELNFDEYIEEMLEFEYPVRD